MSSIHFFTIVARNYLAYAYVLGNSVKQYHPDATFSIFLMDDSKGEYRPTIHDKGFELITPEMIGIPNYQQFVFKYNVTEASTGVKPFVIQHLLDCGAEKIIYLDPDILCFRRLHEVIDALDTSSIVLTPHSTSPLNDDYFPDDHLFLSSGAYNLGFIAVKASAATQKFITWWCQRLANDCLDMIELNLFVDQKWADLVPSYFDEVLIFKNLAYNIAYWNLHERTIRRLGEVLHVFPSETPVAFIHFSGMVVDSSEQISKYGPRSPFSRHQQKKRLSLHDRPDLVEPFKHYAELVLAENLRQYSAIPYAFNTYTNGEPVSQIERSLYGTSARWQQSNSNPFAAAPNSFWQECRRAGIRSAAGANPRSGAKELTRKYRIVFKAIQIVLHILLRLLGPNAYAQFAKYMRQQLLPTNHDFLLKR